LISKQTVDEILARSDIESLIGSYVTLKRAGSNLKGLCPFHNEKSPSFTVYTADNSFYCFGCGIGGNAITFVRQMEHLDYPSAIEFLAKRAGINVVHENEGEYKQKSGLSKERLLKMNVDAAKFFHGMLFSKNPKSQAALRYFARIKYENEVKIEYIELEKGYYVHCRCLDIGDDLLDLKLYAPDRTQAEMIGKNIMLNPAGFYSKILSIALNNEEEQFNPEDL